MKSHPVYNLSSCLVVSLLAFRILDIIIGSLIAYNHVGDNTRGDNNHTPFFSSSQFPIWLFFVIGFEKSYFKIIKKSLILSWDNCLKKLYLLLWFIRNKVDAEGYIEAAVVSVCANSMEKIRWRLKRETGWRKRNVNSFNRKIQVWYINWTTVKIRYM